MWGESEVRIKRTLLSDPPREESGLVAALTTLAVLFVSLLCWRYPDWLYLLAAEPRAALLEGEYWRLFSTIGVHADLKHLLANAPFLAFFTFLLYGYFGFWLFPVLMLLLGGLINYGALLTYAPGVRLVGASGVVYLMAAFWLTTYVLVERTRPLRRRLLHVLGITLIVLVPTSLSPQVSYRTHTIGFLAGVLFALGYFQVRHEWIRSKEVVEVESPPPGLEGGDGWVN